MANTEGPGRPATLRVIRRVITATPRGRSKFWRRWQEVVSGARAPSMTVFLLPQTSGKRLD